MTETCDNNTISESDTGSISDVSCSGSEIWSDTESIDGEICLEIDPISEWKFQPQGAIPDQPARSPSPDVVCEVNTTNRLSLDVQDW